MSKPRNIHPSMPCFAHTTAAIARTMSESEKASGSKQWCFFPIAIIIKQNEHYVCSVRIIMIFLPENDHCLVSAHSSKHIVLFDYPRGTHSRRSPWQVVCVRSLTSRSQRALSLSVSVCPNSKTLSPLSDRVWYVREPTRALCVFPLTASCVRLSGQFGHKSNVKHRIIFVLFDDDGDWKIGLEKCCPESRVAAGIEYACFAPNGD